MNWCHFLEWIQKCIYSWFLMKWWKWLAGGCQRSTSFVWITPHTVLNLWIFLTFSIEKIYSPFAAPPKPSDDDFIETEPGKHDSTQNTIAVDINYSFFKNEQNGKQVFFGIAVCALPNCLGEDDLIFISNIEIVILISLAFFCLLIAR